MSRPAMAVRMGSVTFISGVGRCVWGGLDVVNYPVPCQSGDGMRLGGDLLFSLMQNTPTLPFAPC